MKNILVRIVRLIEDGQPPLLECELEDGAGSRHTFVEKEPIFTVRSPSGYPQIGFIRCEVLQRWKDPDGRELVRVTTLRPDAVESTAGATEFTLFSDSILDGTWNDGSLTVPLK